MDALLNSFYRLRVLTCNVDERMFKLSALDALRESAVYKALKLKPACIQLIERNLVQEHLSHLSFIALCLLYKVEIVVVFRRYHYICGNAKYALCGNSVCKIRNLDTFQLIPAKPIYAISHYSIAELRDIADKLHLHETGTKAIIYAAISNEIQKKIETLEL